MAKRILLIVALTILNSNILYAEQLATVLRGKIIAPNLSDIVVMVKESDGSILDMTDISSTGTFNLDLTIMDKPSLTEVTKLVVEVKDKSGTKKNFFVKKYMNDFNKIVLLEPIILE